MNKKSLIIYYIACLLVPLLVLMYVPFWTYLLFVLFLMFFPSFINKIFTKFKEISEFRIVFLISVILWIGIFDFGTIFNSVCFTTIAKTESVENANEIYKVLENKGYSDRTEMSKYDNEYHLLMVKDKKNNWNKDEVILYLVEKGVITPDVHFDRQIEYKNKEQFENELNRRLNKIINQMEGVSVRMSVCGGAGKVCKASCGKPIISVSIDVDEDADKTYIEKVAKTVVLAFVKDFPEENIKIEFVNQDRKMPEARKLYKQKKYDEILKLFSKHPENYETSIKLLKRLIELDKKISQNPNDYRLYIERADVKNVPVYAMFKDDFQGVTSDYKGAVEDYTKALELNPKAYELFEKRGDAHFDSSFVEFYTDDEEQRSFAISDYEKAIEYTGGNDGLFHKLGNEYYKRKDYKNAYRIYSMMNREYIVNEDNNDLSYMYADWYLIYKVTNCFVQVGEYDKAIELCDVGIKKITIKKLVRRLKLRRLNLRIRRLFR